MGVQKVETPFLAQTSLTIKSNFGPTLYFCMDNKKLNIIKKFLDRYEVYGCYLDA